MKKRPYWKGITKNKRRFKNESAPFQLKFNPLILILSLPFLNVCQTTPLPSYTAPSLTLKAKGLWISPKGPVPYRAYIHLKGNTQLRADLLSPLGGATGGILLKDRQVTLWLSSKKSYYQGVFNSRSFWPEGPAVPADWIYQILRGQNPKARPFPQDPSKTVNQNEILRTGIERPASQNPSALRSRSAEKDFEVQVTHKRNEKELKFLHKKQLKMVLKLKPLSSDSLPDKMFSFTQTHWTRVADWKHLLQTPAKKDDRPK